MKPKISVWWCVLTCFALVLGLAACDSPSIAFSGIPAKRITVEGSTFSIRHTAYEAEAIRINSEWAPSRRKIVIKAVAGMETVSGCKVIVPSVAGDTNIVIADLTCPNASEALRPVRPKTLDCHGYEIGGIAGEGLIDFSCQIGRGL